MIATCNDLLYCKVAMLSTNDRARHVETQKLIGRPEKGGNRPSVGSTALTRVMTPAASELLWSLKTFSFTGKCVTGFQRPICVLLRSQCFGAPHRISGVRVRRFAL